MAETSGDATSRSAMSRRKFLKAVGLGAGTLFGLDRLVAEGIDVSLTATADKMPEGVLPPEFANVPLPEKNEYYRQPEEILSEAFLSYEKSRIHNTKLPPLFFEKRKNYLDVVSFAKKFPRAFEPNEDIKPEDQDLSIRLMQILYGSNHEQMLQNQADGDMYGFSSFSFDGPGQLLVDDTGSGIVAAAVDNYLAKYDVTRKEFYRTLVEGMPRADIQEASDIITKSLREADHFFVTARSKIKGPLPVSTAISYFLIKNKGDIYASLWDTTLYFKVAARNNLIDLSTLVIPLQAQRMATMFKDEFSPHMSFNWLMQKFEELHLPDDHPLYAPNAMDIQICKDFMPINRAGGYYHALNIMTWAAVCMDPQITKDIVLAYYNSEQLGWIDNKPEHGKEKVMADMLVARRAGEIARVAHRYMK